MVAKAQKASQIVYANLIARKSILPTQQQQQQQVYSVLPFCTGVTD